MKKTAIYCSIAVLALGIAACSDDNTYGIPQVNEQGEVFQSKDLSVTALSTIDVSEVKSYGEKVEIADYTITDLPAGYAVEGRFQLSADPKFEKDVIEVPMTAADGALWASADELATGYYETYTKNPATVKMHGRTIVYIYKGMEVMRVGGRETFYGVNDYTFTPANPGFVIEQSYYLVPGDGSTWSVADGVKMKHSDADAYDDPNFNTLVTTNIGKYWIIVPESTFKAGTISGHDYYVPVYDRGTSGDLELNGDLDNPIEINNPTQIDINMQSLTYNQKAAYENYFVTGSGWPSWGAHWMPLFTTDYLNYYGFLHLGNEFKFAPQAGWGGDFGAAQAPGEEEDNGVFNYSGICKDSGDNIKINHEGLYFMHLNADDWSYDLQGINSIGLIGGFNGWNGDLEMTPSEDLYTWTADFTSDGDGWKFRMNGKWDINLGGTEDALWTNGDNITLPAGEYTITLDLSTYPATFKAEKK